MHFLLGRRDRAAYIHADHRITRRRKAGNGDPMRSFLSLLSFAAASLLAAFPTTAYAVYSFGTCAPVTASCSTTVNCPATSCAIRRAVMSE